MSNLTEEEMNQFKPEPVDQMNRSERKARLKFFKKELIKHVERKPTIDIHEDDEEKQSAKIMRVQAWATRYGIFAKKIIELGGKQEDLKRAV